MKDETSVKDDTLSEIEMKTDSHVNEETETENGEKVEKA